MAVADVNLLSGDHQRAAAGHPTLHRHHAIKDDGYGPRGSGVTDPPAIARTDRVGQTSQHRALVVEDLHDTAVETDGDAHANEVVADRVLVPARPTWPQALTSRSTSIGPTGPGAAGGGPAGLPPSASSCRRWVSVSRDGTVLIRVPVTDQVHDGGICP